MTAQHALRMLVIVVASALGSADAVAQSRPQDVPATVRGRVTDLESQRPLAGAPVFLSGRTALVVRTAEDGSYAMPELPHGAYCIRVETPGYDAARVCITLSAGAAITIDLPLTPRPVAMDPLIVETRRSTSAGARTDNDDAHAVPLSQRLAGLGARSAHGAAAMLDGLTHGAQTDPSGGRRPHALYMWGSSAERGRVLLDGASLSAPLHLGALLPPVDPQVIESADVHTAGVSPRYDGGTAYVMNFTTRPAADRQRTWGELDLLAGRIGAETPIHGRGRVLASARRVNDEIIGRLAPARFGYDYRDALVRADLDLGETSGVHVTAFTTDEAVHIPRDLAEDRAAWENRAATLSWRSGDASLVTLSASRGVADLPLLSALGGHLQATLDRFGVLAERRWSTGGVQWETGAEIERHAFRRRASATHDPSTGEPGNVSCTFDLPCTRATTTLASAFAEALFSPARGLTLSLGARSMYDTDARSLHLLPRVALSWLPDEQHSVTLSAGRFSQPFVRETAAAEVEPVSIAHAAHVELEVARRTDRLLLRGSTYLRQHERIEPTGAAHTVPGADLSLEYALPPGMVSFAYSVSGPYRGNGNGGIQHLASAGFHARHGRLMASTTAAYGSGLPLTSIVLDDIVRETFAAPGGPPENTGDTPRAAEPDYLRLDSWLGAEWRIGRGERSMVILPYVRIINSLGQRESLFYFQDSDDVTRPPRALARVPAIPVIGVRWHF
jgi:hypothetical protein